MENNESRSSKITNLYEKNMIEAMKEFSVATKNEDHIGMAKALSKFININNIMGYEMTFSYNNEPEVEPKAK